MNEMKDFIEKDLFAKHLGIKFTEVSEGSAAAEMVVREHHLNSMASVHGGAIFSLADAVFAVASNSHGGIAVAINVSVSFFKGVNTGVLTARAREVSLNRKLATYLIDILDSVGDLIAVFQGTVYRKNQSPRANDLERSFQNE